MFPVMLDKETTITLIGLVISLLIAVPSLIIALITWGKFRTENDRNIAERDKFKTEEIKAMVEAYSQFIDDLEIEIKNLRENQSLSNRQIVQLEADNREKTRRVVQLENEVNVMKDDLEKKDRKIIQLENEVETIKIELLQWKSWANRLVVQIREEFTGEPVAFLMSNGSTKH